MSTNRPTIALIGLGHLGGVLLELLARQDWLGRIVACSRNPAKGEARCNAARLGLVAQGRSPQIDYFRADVSQTEEFAAQLDSLEADLIISTATMLTWWLPELLPSGARARLLQAKFGAWLPLHLAPTLSLMEAVRTSSYTGPVLTAPFPDVVNCILGKIGLAPTCGIGNIDEIVAKVRYLAARELESPIAEVEIDMVAHHALEGAAFKGRSPAEGVPPHFLRIRHRDADVTDALGGDRLLFAPYPLPRGPSTAFFTAGSTLRLARSLLQASETRLHAPAPQGLPGGYPVVVGRGEVRPMALDILDLDQAISINERSHPFDGIERIEDDGTAVLSEDSVEFLRSELSYDCPRLKPAEAKSRGGELLARFAEYAARHDVQLNQIV